MLGYWSSIAIGCPAIFQSIVNKVLEDITVSTRSHSTLPIDGRQSKLGSLLASAWGVVHIVPLHALIILQNLQG